MSSVLSSLFTQLFVPVLSSSVLSAIKKDFLSSEANMVADVIEKRAVSFIKKVRHRSYRPPRSYVLHSKQLRKDVESAARKQPAAVAKSVAKLVFALSSFLVRYPSVEKDGGSYKELVCDLFEAVVDFTPVLKEVGASDEIISYVDMAVKEVTDYLKDGKEKETAEQVYAAIVSFVSDKKSLEVIDAFCS